MGRIKAKPKLVKAILKSMTEYPDKWIIASPTTSSKKISVKNKSKEHPVEIEVYKGIRLIQPFYFKPSIIGTIRLKFKIRWLQKIILCQLLENLKWEEK